MTLNKLRFVLFSSNSCSHRATASRSESYTNKFRNLGLDANKEFKCKGYCSQIRCRLALAGKYVDSGETKL